MFYLSHVSMMGAYPIELWWHNMASRDCVNIGSRNGSMPDDTEPWPDLSSVGYRAIHLRAFLKEVFKL